MLKIGDKVRWESQAQGSWTEKNGTVIAEIPAGESPMSHIPKTAKKSHIKFDEISKRDRVLVAVPAGKDGQITHYYCPSKRILLMQENNI